MQEKYLSRQVVGNKEGKLLEIVQIPAQKPDAEEVLVTKQSVHIEDIKLIEVDLPCGCKGKKVVINGVFKVLVGYVADEPSQSVHAAHYGLPFNQFILLEGPVVGPVEPAITIEDIQVERVNARSFSISIVWGTSVIGNISERCEGICHTNCY
ncbi:MAG: DUF3794 domain-containing protein [Cellulosilyticaceae bacterium]